VTTAATTVGPASGPGGHALAVGSQDNKIRLRDVTDPARLDPRRFAPYQRHRHRAQWGNEPGGVQPRIKRQQNDRLCGEINLNRRQPTAMQIGGSARVTLGENDYAA
jgi:hypothetical protein